MALNDQSGFWQPWREQAGRLQRVPGIAADHAGAAWQMGGCNFLPLDGRYCLVSWFEQGFGKLGLYDMEADKLVCSYLPGYSRMRHLAMDSEYFYCIASHPLQGTAVIALERASGVAIVLAQLPTGSVPGQLSSPQALEFVAGAGQLAQAFFYPPCNDRYQLSARERPPLVIFLHGGPTSAAYPVFDARIQFWTQRGFAVADLNYRGSTGFGRAYRQALAGRWGELDVVDVLALVDELVTRDWVDARRVCVRGSSAGGYTSLLALAGNQRFAAAASWYGVTDPLRLEQVTHKFESDYLGWLLGPEVLAGRSLARCRSPLEVADRMHTPVIFFQGGQDVVVVPEQTRSLVRKLRGQGVPVEYHEFPEQGHGFRSAGRLAFALQKELEFYRQQFLLQQHSDSCGGPRGRSLT
jgi:dipeptidyl aminopeptidase/acylaminoacyl peptidase